MRVVRDDDVPQSFEGARQLEQRGDAKKAIELYEKLLKQSPGNLKIIARLLILYRKQKDYKKENTLIDKAIKVHEQRYAPKKVNKNIGLISKKLNILLGHTDKKGANKIVPKEIEQLEKRKALIQKKLL